MRLLLFLLSCCLWRLTHAQCVVEVGVTNLGVVINCRIKKTGILRVRNLGGIKGYIDLGLTVGDNMGFQPLLEEEERRRSVQGRRRATQGKPSSALGLPKGTKLSSNKTKSSVTASSFRAALKTATNHFQNPDAGVKNVPIPNTSRVRYNFTALPAPTEFHPVGYLKGYATNSTSLHQSSFQCKEQKYIPGIYADKELECMIFHACTYHGSTVMTKSFHCPPLTLFDQSILRCNWWFYVDCKASEKLYDSNIPIAKSYQLMKALDSPLDNNI